MRLVSSGDGDGGMWGQSGSCTGRIPTEIRKLHLRYPKNVHQPWPLALKLYVRIAFLRCAEYISAQRSLNALALARNSLRIFGPPARTF